MYEQKAKIFSIKRSISPKMGFLRNNPQNKQDVIFGKKVI
jgi:hypothetical protein